MGINLPSRTTNARRRRSSVVSSSSAIPSWRQRSIAGRWLDQKVVGRLLDEKAVAFDRVQHAAEATGGLEQREFGLRQQLGETMCGGQTADAAADDGDAGTRIRGKAEGGGGKFICRSFYLARPSTLPLPPLMKSLPDVAAGVPGPVRARVGAESPLECEREREIVLRVDAIVADADLVGDLRSRRQPAADRDT